jgi:hypothetical protein
MQRSVKGEVISSTFDEPTVRKRLATQGITCGAEALRYGTEGQGPSIYLQAGRQRN